MSGFLLCCVAVMFLVVFHMFSQGWNMKCVIFVVVEKVIGAFVFVVVVEVCTVADFEFGMVVE